MGCGGSSNASDAGGAAGEGNAVVLLGKTNAHNDKTDAHNGKTDVKTRLLMPVTVDSQPEAGGATSGADQGPEEDHGMISQLNKKNIFDMLGAMGAESGRRTIIGSENDQGRAASFASKTVSHVGIELDPTQCGLGYCCRKGLKPESPNQDAWCVIKTDAFSIYGVFDGHGKMGHQVSQFVKDNMPKLILQDPRFRTPKMPAMLEDVFREMQSLIVLADSTYQLSAQMSGTTATVCIHDHVQNKLTVAHVADSTCVLGKTKADRRTPGEATALTRDHKPDLKDERARIEKSGGRVIFDGYANHRVFSKKGDYPGLNMSRCLGDLVAHEECGVSFEPEVAERDLAADDAVLLLCSDGVWEFITEAEAVNIVGDFTLPQMAMAAAEKLARESWDRWIKEEGGAVVDDITVLLVHLDAKQPKP
mmetsp:Transcript_71912/g.188461  ORF Transcript_71912/g.188461 Transcript_71912/m.188461 type:complete len:420 (+) Transcript_71912:87-1346(+)